MYTNETLKTAVVREIHVNLYLYTYIHTYIHSKTHTKLHVYILTQRPSVNKLKYLIWDSIKGWA